MTGHRISELERMRYYPSGRFMNLEGWQHNYYRLLLSYYILLVPGGWADTSSGGFHLIKLKGNSHVIQPSNYQYKREKTVPEFVLGLDSVSFIFCCLNCLWVNCMRPKDYTYTMSFVRLMLFFGNIIFLS